MEQKDWKQIYEKLLGKRGLERHRESREWAEREVSGEERKRKLREIQRRIEIIKGKGGEEVGKEETIRELGLEEIIKSLEEEISRIASPEEVETLKTASWKRLIRFMRDRRGLLRSIDELREELKKTRKEYESRKTDRERRQDIEYMDNCSRMIEEAERLLEEELPFRNPESFLAHALLKLREYKKQLPSGIVETEYPKTQKERAEDILAKNRLVALLGETGTGKTRLARKIAEEMTGDYEFVPGHKFITAEDLFYYRGLDVRKIEPSKVPEIIKQEIERFKQEHPDLSEEEIKEYGKIIADVVKGQATSKELTTEVFLSAVLRAAQDGKIVIIDEFNYIPRLF
jgi:hypothetical protein